MRSRAVSMVRAARRRALEVRVSSLQREGGSRRTRLDSRRVSRRGMRETWDEIARERKMNARRTTTTIFHLQSQPTEQRRGARGGRACSPPADHDSRRRACSGSHARAHRSGSFASEVSRLSDPLRLQPSPSGAFGIVVNLLRIQVLVFAALLQVRRAISTVHA